MKKIFVYFAVLAAMLLMISCGGGSTTGDNTDTGTPETDEDSVDSGSSDSGTTEPTDTGTTEPTDTGTTEPTDTGEPDTAPDGGDSQPDDGDSEPDGDSGDSTSEPDEDNADSGDSASDQDTDSGDSGVPTPDQDAGTVEPTTDEDAYTPEPNDEDSVTPLIPDEDVDTIPALTEEGLYFGIIGFNQELYIEDIDLLDSSSESSYKSFIDALTSGNGTGLYFADYTALGMMRDYSEPPNLKNVALVTFTDGLDNISLANDDYNPENYGSQAAYRNALHEMIVDEDGIHGKKIEAYTIGLKGNDVTDTAMFDETLKKLSSSDSNVFNVANMDEAKEHFREIAEGLYSISKTVNLDVLVPGGYDDGQLLRFTFDNKTATTSSLYIEATYRRVSGRTLENITYHGLASLTTVATGTSAGAYHHFVFEELKYADSDTPISDADINKIMLWKETSTGGWDKESEFDPASSVDLEENKNSALIMLVLDCTTSLGSDFARMKQAAKDFVTTLVNGGTETQVSECTGLPANAQWNTASEITQTWNGSSWTPTTTGAYSETASTEKCYFKCASGYTWNGSQCVIPSNPCSPNPCSSISNSTGACTVSGASYVCGCNQGYDWNSSTSKCDDIQNYCSAVFNGTDSMITIASEDAPSIVGLESWTIEAWIKQSADNLPDYQIYPVLRKGTSTSHPEYLLSGYYNGNNGNGYGLTVSTYYSYQRFNQPTTADNQVNATLSTLPEGWSHVAMVYTTATETTTGWGGQQQTTVVHKLTIFINGEPVQSGKYGGAPTFVPNDEPLVFGARNSDRYFTGLIDSIKISSTAKYTEDFTPSVLSKDNDTIAFWDFSGNANDSVSGIIGTPTSIEYSTDCK